MSKEIELHEHVREDIRIDLLCEDVIALTEHLQLKEEECKQLQHDKAELLKALEVSTRAWDQYFKNGEMFDYDEYESHEKLLESMK